MAKSSGKNETPKVDIYKAWCKACGICAAFCPAGVLARDEAGYPYVKEPGKCLNCGWCEIRCPDFAITVEQKKNESEKAKETLGKEDSENGVLPGK